ncbi:competence protein CoiA [Litoribrevibacter albus]|uniref:competence protein CoiA n=1 Tax=Litoribrevibacter albus TaxID=1473156 RepID=UPI0024E0AA4A|nr:competence protein CoiA family protein [Litoribrevibacter albus]
MKYSLVENRKVKAAPRLRGKCYFCGTETIAKCGSKIKWHWAHMRHNKCDTWWENETQWHRDWKSHWPDVNQEVVHFDSKGEKHIADVKNNNSIVIEFQNSPISETELVSREEFYNDMIWVVNGEKFVHNMRYGAKLPDPNHPLCNNIAVNEDFSKNFGYRKSFTFFHISDYAGPHQLVEIHSSEEIKDIIEHTHIGHYLFKWRNPRYVWFKSSKPVLFDFGTGVLWQLMRFNDHSSYCIAAYLKDDFIKDFGGSTSSEALKSF